MNDTREEHRKLSDLNLCKVCRKLCDVNLYEASVVITLVKNGNRICNKKY